MKPLAQNASPRLPFALTVFALGGLLSASTSYAPAQSYSLTPAWQVLPVNNTNGLPAGNISNSGNTDRGLTYNAASNHVILGTRTGGNGAFAFDAATGTYTNANLSLDMTGVAGGSVLAWDALLASDDGKVFGFNVSQTTFKIYLWTNYSSPPYIAYGPADPSSGTLGSFRVGDIGAIRGSGSSIEILAGTAAAGATTNAFIFRTTNGFDFIPTLINVPGTVSGDFRFGLTFYTNNTFLAKQTGQSMRLIQYPANYGSFTVVTGTVIANVSFPAGNDPAIITYEPNSKLLAGIVGTGSAVAPKVVLFNLANVSSPVPVSTNTFNAANANGNATGAIAFGGAGKTNDVFSLWTNDGILASLINFTPAVTPPSVGPVAGATVYTNIGSYTLTASASGSLPLSYQWYYSANSGGPFAAIGLATNGSIIITPTTVSTGGYYRVIVTNLAGAATSAPPALLTVLSPITSTNVSVLWRAVVGSQPFLLSSDYGTRGIAYSAYSNVVLVASHSASSNGIYLMDGNTGSLVGAMNAAGLDPNGTFGVDQVGVADDGVVYACNLAASGQKLDIYSWSSADPAAFPNQAYGPDGPDNPGNGSLGRWGDTMAVRGAGTGTQIIMGSYLTGTNVALFTTSDGVTFTPMIINITDVPAGFAGLGIAFGSGNTFYAKTAGSSPQGNLRLCSFDTNTLTGATLLSYTAGSHVPTSMTGIGADVTNKILAATVVGDIPHDLQLLQLSGNANPPALFNQSFYPSFNANVQFNAAVAIGGGRAYSVDANNGIIALSYTVPVLPPAPTITDVSHAGTSTTVTWTTFNGRNYQLQSRDSLTSGAWANVGSPVVGSGPTASATDTSATPTSRFYRVSAY